MTQCNATAELMDASMRIIPGITLRCELEAGHTDAERLAREYCGGRPEDHPATEHAFTFRWADPTVDELREVLDPDESFDLEVDIAPAEVIAHQVRVTADAEPIREARRRCSVCGREVIELIGLAVGWVHRFPVGDVSIADHDADPI